MSDPLEASNAPRHRFRPFASVLASIRFLTRLPVPFVRTIDPPPMNSAMAMFPVAGALVGAITALVLVAGEETGLPLYFTAVLAIAVTALVTGALHEDGLADVADGFGGGGDFERRLEIMRDSRIGTYGTIALLLALLARTVLFAEIMQRGPLATLALTPAAGAFSRALMVDLLWATRPARRDGLSVMAGRPSRSTTLVALALGGLGAGLAGGYVISPAHGVLGLVAAGIATGAVRALAMRKIGGQTGDVCGAAQVVSELAMLALFSATFSLD